MAGGPWEGSYAGRLHLLQKDEDRRQVREIGCIAIVRIPDLIKSGVVGISPNNRKMFMVSTGRKRRNQSGIEGRKGHIRWRPRVVDGWMVRVVMMDGRKGVSEGKMLTRKQEGGRICAADQARTYAGRGLVVPPSTEPASVV